jgi:hypothetical protein
MSVQAIAPLVDRKFPVDLMTEGICTIPMAPIGTAGIVQTPPWTHTVGD